MGLLILLGAALAGNVWAATDVKVSFTLNTTDADGSPVAESRYYYVYRPDNLSMTNILPLVLCMSSGGDEPMTFYHTMADQAGFVLASCSFKGNYQTVASWNSDDPAINGPDDMDYTTSVIDQVTRSNNCGDVFICGLSKGGHMALSYACERPDKVKAACSVEEFMQLAGNIPKAPIPAMVMLGTSDSLVSPLMVKDTIDAWRTRDGLMNTTPVTTFEPAPLNPSSVTQVTWKNGYNQTQVAFVSIIGGTHEYPQPTTHSGYDCTAGMWAFFSQHLTVRQAAPKVVAQPLANIQVSGRPASFHVTANGAAPLSYQWQRNGTNLPGATANWHTTPPTSSADNASTFRVIVFNSSGSVTSATATLTINAAPAGPAITSHPADQLVTAGQPASFSVSATGTGLTYQWKKNGLNIAGATSSTYTLPLTVTADSGNLYTVGVTNSTGGSLSRIATLTVNAVAGAPAIHRHPVRVRVLDGQAATFSVSARSKTPMTYQWQKQAVPGSTGNMVVDIPGATNATYTTPVPTVSDNITYHRCRVSNAAGTAISAHESLLVTTSPKAPTDIGSSLTACAQVGVPFAYTLISGGGTVPITFDASPLPAGLTVNHTTGVISGTPTAPGTTRVVLYTSNSAGSAPTRTLTLTVTADPPAIPLELWRTANFGASAYNADVAADTADPDGDGLNNFQEYALGSDPFTANAPAWSYAATGGFLTLSIAKNPNATNVTWVSESGADLGHWQAGDTTVLQSAPSLFMARDNFPVTTAPHRFLRVRIASP